MNDTATRSDIDEVITIIKDFMTLTAQQFERVDNRFAAVDRHFVEVDHHFEAVHQRLDNLDQKYDHLITTMNGPNLPYR